MEQFITTNNIQLAYVDHSAEAGEGAPVLVLMHGLSANCHEFDGLIAAGLNRRMRVIMPDLRGRGQSDKPTTGYTMADHAADILGLCDTLGLERVVLGGHSFGGLLSIYMAARHPERIERMVIIDAARGATTPRTAEIIKPSLARLGQVFPGWEFYLAAIKQAPYYAGWAWDPAIESYYRADVQTNPDGTIQARARPEHIAAAIDGVVAEDWDTLIAAARTPAILINATEPFGPPGAPPVVSEEDARTTAEALGNCTYIHVPGNHITMVFGEGAWQIVAAMEQFISPS